MPKVGAAAPALLLQKTVSVPHTDFLTLSSVPYVVLPAPGAGRAIDLVHAVMYANTDSGAYVAPGNLYFITDTTAFDPVGSLVFETINGLSFEAICWPIPQTIQPAQVQASTVLNMPLYFTINADPTGGSPLNVIELILLYRIVTLP